MTAIPEVNALESALQSLKDPSDPIHLATLSRKVIRAADDLEFVAEETANRTTRENLLNQVAQARKAVAAARKLARQAALTADRTKLLEQLPETSKEEVETDAARVAKQINDSLRRTTAIVSEEIDRSRAAGNVIDESTRKLRMTRDQHGRYGESLSSGALTLKSIRSSEMIANVLIVLSFAIFFLAAAYVTKQRLANSNISTFVLRPGIKVASLPLRIVAWMVRAIGINELKSTEVDPEKGASPAQEADEAQKAKEGRGEEVAFGEHDADIKIGAKVRVEETAGSDEEKLSCDAEQKCSSGENDESDNRNEEKANDSEISGMDSDLGQDTVKDMEIINLEVDSGATKEDPMSEQEELSIGQDQSSGSRRGQDGDSSTETGGEGIPQNTEDDAGSHNREGDFDLDSIVNDMTEQPARAVETAEE